MKRHHTPAWVAWALAYWASHRFKYKNIHQVADGSCVLLEEKVTGVKYMVHVIAIREEETETLKYSDFEEAVGNELL